MTGHPTANEILKAVADIHLVALSDLLTPCRKRAVARARWHAMHLLRTTPKPNGRIRSLPEIGRALGGLDHTTVLYGLRRHAGITPEQASSGGVSA